MAFFLRYTATPKKDMKRGTSLHVGEGEKYVKQFGCKCTVLDGLCAHEVDGEDLEDAIQDAISTVLWARKNSGASGNYPEGDGFAAYLFEGEVSEDDRCDDGILFHATRLVANISELAV